ncbi:hypothetical protein [Pusillimonas sp. NJUB218]|uniref:hypothetical protein n=1 Tax=Pusillimonas sp. NJUB218 TaxID=2023230 RepID=UPI000F4AF866|nr:hypothetical protein [Pusillimonas sp. NJUB218]ROT45050.1 hypothetical protein CHR62_09370 [Pusillimonas sp. NJUB218]
MTTKKDASGTPDYVGVVDSGPFPPIKRYDLGTHFYNSLSVPEIVETADGKYVTYDDYLIMVKINDYLQARLAKQAAQMEAIGAGGVSGKRITSPDAAELVSDAAEIIDTLTCELPANHPIRASAQNRAKRRVQELYVLAESISKTEGEKS